MNPSTPADQRRQYWREHIDAYLESGESGATYCKRCQLSYHQFNYWRRKSQDQDSTGLMTACESNGFARVVASHRDAPSGLSLALPNGLVIQDIRDTNVAVVRQLLAIL